MLCLIESGTGFLDAFLIFPAIKESVPVNSHKTGFILQCPFLCILVMLASVVCLKCGCNSKGVSTWRSSLGIWRSMDFVPIA